MRLFLLCIFYWSSQCVSAREIIISEKGSDTSSCLEVQNVLVSCQSLVNVSKYVTSHKLNNVIIRLSDSNYFLQGVANFSGVENISITGNGNLSTEISCNTFESGIAFDHSKQIALQDFTISNCGAPINTNRSNLTGNSTAIQIINCLQVNVSRIVVSRSICQGLTLINTGSTVRVIDSQFINNTVSRSHWLGNGALQVILHGSAEILNTETDYTIVNSMFINNGIISNKMTERRIVDSFYCYRGGGIRILFLEHFCRDCSITLDNNTLEGNHAVYGGGAFIYVSGNTSNSKVRILTNFFISNTALVSGGGLEICYIVYTNLIPFNNTCLVRNSSFVNNTASNGGGLSTYSSSIKHINYHGYNTLKCKKCHFERNSAQCGSAVSATRGLFSGDGSTNINRVYFYDCIFKNNVVIFKSNVAGDKNGAFFISEVDVTLADTIYFTENNGTALYLHSTGHLITYAIFDANGSFYFIRNSGYNGGAIVLSGHSALYAHSDGNSSFYFMDNTATKLSGAISALTSKIIFKAPKISENTCFLKLMDHWIPSNVTTVSFYFHNNTASIGYSDIYTTSLLPCNKFCNRKTNNISHFFQTKCFGSFTFTGSGKNTATSPKNFTIRFQGTVLPGIEHSLTIAQYDEFEDDVSIMFPFTARVQSSKQNAKVANFYNNSIIIVGFPGDEGELLLESSTYNLITRFNLTFCGPGFEFYDESLKCTCSKNYNFIQCENSGSAAITSNYWAGYISNTTPDNLLTGLCVAQLCNPVNYCDHGQFCTLPPIPDEQALEKRICGDSRHGRLCGRCNDNMSVYYHSGSYTCGNNTSCYYGIPIYIASELLPVTIIFLIILLFNISLTSGAVYSFVFYIQILSRINISAFKTIHIENHFTQNVVDFFQLVIGIFSFEVHNGEFCIFQTQTIMNLLMIQCATLAYAFFLVLATILIMRMHSCYSCVKLCRQCGRKNIRGSIVDGLSAFIVLCYFQCATITSRILTPSHLYGIHHRYYTTVPLFDGELDYLKGNHLCYAIPAFLCVIFILIPPPIILILEPLLTKVFNMDYFMNTAPKWYYNKLRLKLMPFFDSFQACFKDQHRYFAGLYFLYRLLFITISGIIVQEPQYFYSLVICLFMFIIPLHAFIQPYKKKWHELSEMSLFIIVVSLLMITLYNFAFYRSDGTALIIVQLILIFLSIGYMVIYVIIKLYRRMSALKMKEETPVNREFIDVSDSLPHRLLNDNNGRNSYRSF